MVSKALERSKNTQAVDLLFSLPLIMCPISSQIAFSHECWDLKPY